jgi:hypothetical protein
MPIESSARVPQARDSTAPICAALCLLQSRKEGSRIGHLVDARIQTRDFKSI